MTPNPDQLSTPETASFWAKTGDKDSPTRGLPLVQHMLDAGSVAARSGTHGSRPVYRNDSVSISISPWRYARARMLARRHPRYG